ncbi:hypothetical protein [Haliangium sp.]|uniref:hypothetical protein n=1 Tax=Haliangium sp. TaxID=2663208 RepID=UPI003D146327
MRATGQAPSATGDDTDSAYKYLDGSHLTVIRGLSGLIVVLAVVAGVSYFGNWHAMPARGSDVGAGLACAFMPDCHPSPARSARGALTGPLTYDTGYDHSGLKVPMLLMALVMVSLGIWRGMHRLVGVGRAAAMLFLCAGLFVGSFDLKHMLERTRELPASWIFGLACVSITVVAFIGLIVQVALYVRAYVLHRRSLAGPSLPEARVSR